MYKYIDGFSQEEIIKINDNENGLYIDAVDVILLEWFSNSFPTAKKHLDGNNVYAWVSYDKIIEDIPIVRLKKHSIYLRLKKMCELGILTHKTINNNGTFSYYGFGENYRKLINC